MGDVQSAATPLNVVNRGWDRYGVSGAPFASEAEQPWVDWHPIQRVETVPMSRSDYPWAKLQWWESEWQAARGIETMCSRPFLDLRPTPSYADGQPVVPTRVLYPYAIKSSEKPRIEQSARYVAAMVRQAREFYTAAQSAGVTDLSRPVLYFYGALALAKAATAALFGRDRLEKGHGLDSEAGPSAQHDMAPWSTVIKWRQSGEFVMLCRAARWDADLYRSVKEETQKKCFEGAAQPKFHLLECIRWLGYDWGLLPPTGFEKPPNFGTGRTDRERCLLAYRGPGDMFLRRDTSLDAPLYQVPLIVVQYMVLYGFSIIARYNGLEWQELLAAANGPEGHVFRVALENVAADYVEEVTRLLPRPQDNTLYKVQWSAERPDLDRWYRPPVERTGGFVIPYPDFGRMEEWDGE